MNTKYMNKVLGGMTACLLFFGACFFASCDDYLDVTPMTNRLPHRYSPAKKDSTPQPMVYMMLWPVMSYMANR